MLNFLSFSKNQGMGGVHKEFGIGFVVMGYRNFFYPIFLKNWLSFGKGYRLLIYKINSKTI
jgi:hypothetical protein